MKLFNAHTKTAIFIALMIQVKGLELECVTTPNPYHPNERGPVLDDAGLAIKGIDRIIEFIEHKYPAPPLLPQDPTHRAAERMLIDEIIKTNYGIQREDTRINGLNPPELGDFILGRKLSLADIVLYPIIPDNNKFWQALKKLIEGQLK